MFSQRTQQKRAIEYISSIALFYFKSTELVVYLSCSHSSTFMLETKNQLETNLLADKEDIASELHSEWLSMKANFRRTELKTHDDDNAGIDVRLVIKDDCWELITGDVQFDTCHGDYCASGFLDFDWEESEVEGLCVTLAEELIGSIAEEEAWS